MLWLRPLLQGFIWKERGHARDFADFLFANGLVSPREESAPLPRQPQGHCLGLADGADATSA